MQKMAARLFLLSFLLTSAVQAAEVTRAGRWEFHSSFWMNLHLALMHDASVKTPRTLDALTPEERATWTAAVETYKAANTAPDITFAQPMVALQDDLTQVADDARVITIDGPLADTMRAAAAVYSKHWWSADDLTNRFFISYASAMVRDAGEELAAAHERVYRAKMPETFRVHVTRWGGQYGAYTHGLRTGGWTTIMSSNEPGYQGLLALEMILHESSHSIVGPRGGTVAAALNESAKRHGIAPPSGLWHAILFDTTSELTKRALAKRGSPAFVPSSVDLFTRVWPRYRKPIEDHWHPYLAGEGTLETAIDRIVASVVSK
jgi:hypothetical protein